MAIPMLGDLIHEIGESVRQIIPDPKTQAEFQVRMAELADRADARESELLAGQMGVNKEEARHANLFVAGWRPAVGWTCAAALAWTWIVAPLMVFLVDLRWEAPAVPALTPESIFPVLTAMLGIGAMRTFEKTRGVATSVGGKVLTPVTAVPGPQPVQSSSPAVSPATIEDDAPAPPKARRRIPLPNWLD